jgi:hypothetical protein
LFKNLLLKINSLFDERKFFRKKSISVFSLLVSETKQGGVVFIYPVYYWNEEKKSFEEKPTILSTPE